MYIIEAEEDAEKEELDVENDKEDTEDTEYEEEEEEEEEDEEEEEAEEEEEWQDDVEEENEQEEKRRRAYDLARVRKIADLKEEFEKMRVRIERAERAAEREYMPCVPSETDKSDDDFRSHEGKTKKSRKKKGIDNKRIGLKKTSILSNAAKLRKKRKAERKRKKLQACLEEYVGPAGTVKTLTYGVDMRRTYDIKCPECGTSATKLKDHLVIKHKYSEYDAKFKESEIRIMFLWAQKEKHGVAKPLPCETCGTWQMRLDNHLKFKHKDFSKEKVSLIMKESKNKYWHDLEKSTNTLIVNDQSGNERTSAAKSNSSHRKMIKKQIVTASSTVVSSGACYVPTGALMISDADRRKWGIIDEDFTIYYENSDDLLEAFVTELAKKHPLSRADSYRRHLEYIWKIIDPQMKLFPKCAFSNSLLVEDRYHNITLQMVGNGGNEASTLRVRFTALRYFINFLRRRHVFAGLFRTDCNKVLEYIDVWNADFTKLIAQRKTDLRRIKLKRLITPKHMIQYGTSKYVQSLVSQLGEIQSAKKFTKRFCLQVRDYVITNLCFMNGLRSSNIIELRLTDVEEATRNAEYPGYMVFMNSTYKTSTIYGEKVLVLPDNIFNHLKIYINKLRPVISGTKSNHLFVSSDGDIMSHGSIGNALTSSFSQATVFTVDEYTRVCPTRIRCACATFGCKAEGIDSGFFAKHFMKNKEDTTNIHYNLYSNHREALKLAMLIGDTFEVGGTKKCILKQEVDQLTQAILETEKSVPSSEEILGWIKKHDTLDSKELASFMEILDSMETDVPISKSVKPFYGKRKQLTATDSELPDNDDVLYTDNDDVEFSQTFISKKRCRKSVLREKSSVVPKLPDNDDVPYTDNDDVEFSQTFISKKRCRKSVLREKSSVVPKDFVQQPVEKKTYPKRNRKCLNSREAHCAVEKRCSEVSGDDCSEDEWVADDELEEVSEETDQNLLTEKNMKSFDVRKHDDIIYPRKVRRSLLLVLTVVCKKLILRPDAQNVLGVTAFTAKEVERCIRQDGPAKSLLSQYSGEDLKFCVLNLRKKYQQLVKLGKIYMWNKWIGDANDLMNC